MMRPQGRFTGIPVQRGRPKRYRVIDHPNGDEADDAPSNDAPFRARSNKLRRRMDDLPAKSRVLRTQTAGRIGMRDGHMAFCRYSRGVTSKCALRWPARWRYCRQAWTT